MPHDPLVEELVAKIDADIAAKEQELKARREMRAYVLRYNGPPPEQAPLFENGAEHGPARPGLKTGGAGNNNREMFRSILRDVGKPMTARQVWAEATKRGAVTTSTNPLNMTHGSLYAMVRKGVRKAGKGKYVYDAATAPAGTEGAHHGPLTA